MNFFISLVSFAVCIGAATLLAKTSFFSFLNARNSRFETIDGLRGFLALSVFFHHFVVTYYWKLSGEWARPQEDFYQNYGKVGVAIFFMITGFLFTSKILKSEGNMNWYKVYKSRVFRIFPLYIFALLCVTLVVLHNSSYELISSYSDLIKQYLKWGLFIGGNINDFENTKLVIAKVDWTLKYEWLFYLFLPVLSHLVFRGGKYAVATALSLCVVFFVQPVDLSFFTTKYFLLFAVGSIAAWLVRINKNGINLANSNLISTVNLLLLTACIFYPHTFDLIHVTLISCFFILVVFGNDLFGLLRAKSSIMLGEISYSIYLLHGFILYMLFTEINITDIATMNAVRYSLLMPVISIVVIIVSSITFLLIEKRFIDYGRKSSFTRLVTA
jgi:peptidoglycan/LPS O-acetylase OafA/YrhL